MSGWARGYFDALDAMDLERCAPYYTEDARMTFGNAPTVEGKPEVVEAIGHFLEMIDGISHELVEVWGDGDATTLVESRASYVRKDGNTVTLPSFTVLRKDGELVRDVRIFADVAPLFLPGVPSDAEVPMRVT